MLQILVGGSSIKLKFWLLTAKPDNTSIRHRRDISVMIDWRVPGIDKSTDRQMNGQWEGPTTYFKPDEFVDLQSSRPTPPQLVGANQNYFTATYWTSINAPRRRQYFIRSTSYHLEETNYIIIYFFQDLFDGLSICQFLESPTLFSIVLDDWIESVEPKLIYKIRWRLSCTVGCP